jgi:hypothetical protein
MTAVLDREPSRCPDHRTRQQAGCKPCQLHNSWDKRARRRRHAGNAPVGLVPATDAANHLLRLTDEYGWSFRQLGARTGYSHEVLSDIRRGRRAHSVQAATWDTIRSVPLGPPPSPRYVPSLGVHRRIRAMLRHGYTLDHMAAAYGTVKSMFSGLLNRDQVTPATHERVAALYRQLAVTPGPSAYGRARAATPKPGYPRGWPGPMCWTPDTIDDPAAGPDWGDAPAAFRPSRCRAAACPILQLRDRRRRLDHAAVEQCLLGIRTAGQMSTAERIAVVTRLAGQGLDDVAIAARTRWTSQSVDNPGQAVTQFRANHGLAAGRPRVGWAA